MGIQGHLQKSGRSSIGCEEEQRAVGREEVWNWDMERV